jgi:hypothetical protein
MSLHNYKELLMRCIIVGDLTMHYNTLASLEAAVLRCKNAMTMCHHIRLDWKLRCLSCPVCRLYLINGRDLLFFFIQYGIKYVIFGLHVMDPLLGHLLTLACKMAQLSTSRTPNIRSRCWDDPPRLPVLR